MQNVFLVPRHIGVFVAVALALAVIPSAAQEGGLEQDGAGFGGTVPGPGYTDYFTLSDEYGDASGSVTWLGPSEAVVAVTVADSAYDGWCAALDIDAENSGLIGPVVACGVDTFDVGIYEVAPPPGDVLGDVTFNLCGYYDPSGTWDCHQTRVLFNPLI